MKAGRAIVSRPRLALLGMWVVLGALTWPATAQADTARTPAGTPASTPASTGACTAASDLKALHLYGLWRVQFDDGEVSSVLFERHPQYADSLRGAVNRGGRQSLLSGDVDDGELVLDESDDGQRISAVWTAQATPSQCGREFTGQRRASDARGTGPASPAPRRFVLRRVPGWN